jgi:hypothetical protein
MKVNIQFYNFIIISVWRNCMSFWSLLPVGYLNSDRIRRIFDNLQVYSPNFPQFPPISSFFLDIFLQHHTIMYQWVLFVLFWIIFNNLLSRSLELCHESVVIIDGSIKIKRLDDKLNKESSKNFLDQDKTTRWKEKLD